LTPDGKPRIFGDLAAYWVMNDLNLSGHASTGRTTPMGLEVHNYFFGSNESEAISNTIFMGMNIINKSTITYDSTFIGFFSDTDLGDYGDDYTGCDTARSLGYTYNGGSVDAVYGAACPATGYDFIEGPMVPGTPTDSAIVNGKWLKGYRNLPMTAFTKFINGGGVYNDPPLGNSDYTRQAYNLLNGYIGQSGAPFKDPKGHPSKFVDPGDPVTGTGWLASFEAGPSDTRELLASGPFTLQPGDTQEVFIAFVIGQGTDPLNSITILRRYDDSVQMALYNGFSTLSGVQKDKGVGVPEKYSLSQNYPNPFNPSTRIRYTLPNRCNVKIVIMNTLGQEVGVLENAERSAGYHEAVWHANVASGMYFYRIEAVGISDPNTRFTQVKKMVLLK